MNINDMFPSKYLKADDIQVDTSVTISHLVYEQVGDESKPVLYFQGSPKGMILNKTNATSIAQAYGTPESDQWVGKGMMLVREYTDWPTPNTPCLRLRPPLQQPAPQAALGTGPTVAPNIPVQPTNIIPNAAAVPFGSTGTAQQFTEANPPPVGQPVQTAKEIDDEIPF